MSTQTKADAAFCRDVPPDMWDDVLTRMSEAAHDDRYADKDISIINRDWINACNVRVSGTIQIGDTEHWFILESGDRAGTVIRAWDNAGDQKFEYHEPTRWALAPKPATIDNAILAGKGPFLIMKWDAIAARPDASDLVRSYAYDRHFQPGGQIEKHYRDKADKLGFQIITEEYAQDIRKRLQCATEPLST